jgi:hydrophobic/amphiphilic exporter-1 (mainly G- bacteria), HAE1 family
LKGFIGFFIQRPVTTLMTALAFILIGVLGILNLPREFYPELETPKLVVSAPYSIASTGDIRTMVTIPLEDALSSLQGLARMESISRPGLALIELELQWGTDMLFAGIQAREIIDSVWRRLPSDMKKPVVLAVDPNQQPLMTIGVIPESMTLVNLKKITGREIKTELQQVEGVASTILAGGREKELVATVEASLLNGRGLSLEDLAKTIGGNNLNYPAGTIRDGNKELMVKAQGRAEEPDELDKIPLLNRETGQVFILSDIADVAFELKEQQSYFGIDGKEGVGLILRRRVGENPVKVADQLKIVIDTLNRRYDGQFSLIILEDSTIIIRKNLWSLTLSLVTGMIMSFIILFLFTKELGPAIILLLSIPLSLSATLGLLFLFDVTLNIMSLGGLALGIGMLVDNSVVILENLQKKKAFSPFEIYEGTTQMARSTLGSTFTSVIIFLPILFLPGLIGSLYKDLALSISFSLLISFLVSISFTPVGYMISRTRFFRNKKIKRYQKTSWYRRNLRRLLRYPFFILPLIIVALLPFFIILPSLKINFIAETVQNKLNLTIKYPPGTSLIWIKKQDKLLSDKICSIPGVKSVYSRIGAEDEDIFYLSDPEESASLLHITINYQRNPIPIKQEINLILISISTPFILEPTTDPLMQILGIKKQGTWILSAENCEDLTKRTEQIRQYFSKKGEKVEIYPNVEIMELHIFPKRDQLSRFNLDLTQLISTVHASLEGVEQGHMNIEGIDYPIRFRIPFYGSFELENISILTSKGKVIPVSELAEFRWEKNSARLLRINRMDAKWIDCEDSGTFQSNPPFSDLSTIEGSLFQRYSMEILLLFLVSIFLLYLYLGAQFESFSQPLLMLTAIPLGASGGISALVIMGLSLNLQSALGILVLFGLVVNNSILLVDAINRETASGIPRGYAILKASESRLRPILITSLTTLFALLPLGINLFGESPQQGLAVVITGGLLLSTTLTLFIIPGMVLLLGRPLGEKNMV